VIAKSKGNLLLLFGRVIELRKHESHDPRAPSRILQVPPQTGMQTRETLEKIGLKDVADRFLAKERLTPQLGNDK